MAFLQKTKGGTYRLGSLYRAAFNPSNPPRNADGEVLVAVERALAAGRTYYLKPRWKNLQVTNKEEAERLQRDFEREQEGTETPAAYDDLLFRDALAKVLPSLAAKDDFEHCNRPVVNQLERFFGARYLRRIKVGDVQKYVDAELKRGLVGATVKRRLNTLGSVYKLFRQQGIYLEAPPTAGVNIPNSHSQPREVTLENWQQRALLKACWDPKLLAIFEQCMVEGKGQLHKWSKNRLALRLETSEVLLKRVFKLFKSREAEVKALGYEQDLKRVFDHCVYQNHGRTLDPETLYDIVLLTLTYGLRKGETIGVGNTVHSKTIRKLGLRAGHWDPGKNVLTVMRTKLKDKGGVKRSQIMVAPHIAAMMNKRCKDKEPDDFVFDNRGLQINDFAKCYEEAVNFAGIEVEITNEKGMQEKIRPQFRDLRHVACTNMIDINLGVEEVARILGHTNTVMIQKVYNNRSKESTQLKQAKLMEDGINKILGV
jgi:integrase